MTTTAAGGKITGLLALSCQTDDELEEGDHVQMSGNYEVELADGTGVVIGQVSVPNKGRVGSTFPDHITPNGPCTVEAHGLFVSMDTAGTGGVTAGDPVMPDGTGRKLVTATLPDDIQFVVGTALTTAAANGSFDCLHR